MSWKDKLANKTTGQHQLPAITINNTPSQPPASGWRLKMQGPSSTQEQTAPRQTTIDINDTNLFPALGVPTSTPAAPAPKKTLTGYAALAKDWAITAKEDAAREEAELQQRRHEEQIYNYSAMNALQALNAKLYKVSDSHSDTEEDFN